MKACHSVVIAAHSHLGFEGIAALISQNPKYSIACYEDQAQNLLQTLQRNEADLLIMCYRFAGESAGDTIAQLKQAMPAISVLIVSAQPRSFDAITNLYDAGANAFLCSTTANQQALFNALDEAIDGNTYYTNSYKDRLIETTVISRPPDKTKNAATADTQAPQLGPREKQVLGLIAQGLSAKEIARQLDISKNTVDVHRRNIMIKLKLRKSTELTRYAIENKLL